MRRCVLRAPPDVLSRGTWVRILIVLGVDIIAQHSFPAGSATTRSPSSFTSPTVRISRMTSTFEMRDWYFREGFLGRGKGAWSLCVMTFAESKRLMSG